MKMLLVVVMSLFLGCIELTTTQTVHPTGFSLVMGASGDTATETLTSSGVRIELDPDTVVMTEGNNVTVKVSVFDLASGIELTSQERGTISYSFDHDPLVPVIAVLKVSGRWLTFLGLKAGTANATIVAAGASGILHFQVNP